MPPFVMTPPCLLAGTRFESVGEDYLQTIALVEACYRSHLEGRVIHLSPPVL